MKNNASLILEYAWLVMAVLCAGVSVHSTMQTGWKNSIMAYLITVIALLMFFARRYRRNQN